MDEPDRHGSSFVLEVLLDPNMRLKEILSFGDINSNVDSDTTLWMGKSTIWIACMERIRIIALSCKLASVRKEEEWIDTCEAIRNSIFVESRKDASYYPFLSYFCLQVTKS